MISIYALLLFVLSYVHRDDPTTGAIFLTGGFILLAIERIRVDP